MALTEAQRDRLAELRAKDADKDTAEQEEKDALELDTRELLAACEAKGWKPDHDFKVVSNRLAGVYAVRKPDTRGIRTWENSTEKQRLQLEWVIPFLRHYIVETSEAPAAPPPAPGQPSQPQSTLGPRSIEWSRASAQRPGLCWQTLRAFLELMGVNFEDLEKK